MNTRLEAVILFIAFGCCLASAQSRRSERNESKRLAALVEQYSDSLQQYKARLDSLASVNESLSAGTNSGKYYRLFSPLTYFPDVYGREMNSTLPSLTSDLDTEIDKTLAQTYIAHPEYVETTVDRLHKSAATQRNLPVAPVKQKVEIVKEVQPSVEEAVGDTDTPVDVFMFKPNFWTFGGDYSLQFLQNYISDNWYKGGENSLSAVGAVTLKANYNNKQKVKFENTLEMKLGLQTSESDTLHYLKTSTDQIRYTGKLGLQATKKWYYTAQVIATTQFMRTYKSNDKTVYSDFLSPLEVNVSLGMDYNVEAMNKKLTGSVHIAPLAYNFKYVDRLALSTRYGIDEGDHSLHDFGSQFTVNLTWKPCDMIKWGTRLYGYTTYHRTVLEWENTVSFALNKYIATTLYFYPRFDDSATRTEGKSYWQLKEYLSIGFSYSM